MMNMVIAFMGESFSFCMEQVDKIAIMSKVDIIASQAPTMKTKEDEDR